MIASRGMEQRVVVFALVAVSAACGATHPPSLMGSPGVLLTPRSTSLIVPALDDETNRLRVTIRGATDSVERTMSEKTWGLHAVAGSPGNVLVTSLWPAPYTSVDSLVVERRGLAPISERLSFRGVTREYRFHDNRVTGTAQHADSAPRAIDRTFSEPVFAFSEVELLVRSLPFTRGFTAIAPLFSENDEDVEHDTMTVVARDAPTGREPGWVVRFADPAIVTRYVIGERSRAILAAETTQRKSGARLRYVIMRK